jgi:predicted PhzF superfamily epimerase YddE/YHI9
MKLPLYQIDAFASEVFRGNPAAVCPVETWPEDRVLQAIAAENNLSETAFFLREGERYHLRWFTPALEVDLCGHATLAAAYVIFEYLEPGRTRVEFRTRGGPLVVAREGERLAMDFPSRPAAPCEAPEALLAGLGHAPRALLRARDYLAVFETEEAVRELAPRMDLLARVDWVIVTAPGRDCDFVSRFFAPGGGIPEDPVTGSAHCTLIPYWSQRLGKRALYARQVSARGGELWCEDQGDRVHIAGHAVRYMEGTITF